MATPEEEKRKKQEEINKLLEQENQILREKLRLQSESFDLSSGLVDALKETLGIRSKQTTFEGTLLNINKDINKAILNQKGGLSDISSIQKQITKNEESLGKAKLTQTSLERSIGEEGKKKTKTVFDLFKAQQDLQAELQAELDKAERGLEINQSLVESTQKQIALNEKSIQKEASKLSSFEQQYVFSQLNTEELEKQNKLREKEKEYQDNINKSMGLTGALASGLETTLKKLGFSKLSEQLGIKDALGKTEEFAKKITAGSNGVATMGQRFQIATKLITTMGSNLMKSLGPLALLGELLTALIKADKATGDLAKSFGVSYKEASNIRGELNDIANLSNDININTGRLHKSLLAINQAFGTNTMLSGQLLKDFTQMVEVQGYSNEAAVGLTKISTLTGKEVNKIQKEILGQAVAFNRNNKLALNEKEILEAVAKTSDRMKLSLGLGTKELTKAVAEAKKLGLTLDEVAKIGDSLLQFETSISAELEAELLTGKQINLEKARYYALTNDTVGLARELSREIGTSADFSKMNRIAQESLAKSFGMSADQLGTMLSTQEALQRMNVEDEDAARKKFDSLEKIYGYEEAVRRVGDEKYGQQLKSQSIQEKFNASVEKLQEIFVSLVQPLLPVLDIFMVIVKPIAIIAGKIGEVLSGLSSMLAKLLEIKPVLYGLGTLLAVVLLPKMLLLVGSIGRGLMGAAKSLKNMVTSSLDLVKNLAKGNISEAFSPKTKSANILPDVSKVEKGGEGMGKKGATSGFKDNMTNIAEGLKAMGQSGVLKGVLNTALAGPALLVALPSMPFLLFMGKVSLPKLLVNFEELALGLNSMSPTLKGSTALAAFGLASIVASPSLIFLGVMGNMNLPKLLVNFEGLALGLNSMSSTFVGSAALAAFGLASIVALPSLIFLGGIALLGKVGAIGLTALGAGLASLGGVAATGLPFIAIGLIAALGASMIPFAYALNLATPAIQAFGDIIFKVFTGMSVVISSAANGISQIFSTLKDVEVSKLLAIGPALMGIGIGLAALGGGGALGAIGAGISKLIGGESPIEKIGKLAALSTPISLLSTSLREVSVSLLGVSSSLNSIDVKKLEAISEFSKKLTISTISQGIITAIASPIKTISNIVGNNSDESSISTVLSQPNKKETTSTNTSIDINPLLEEIRLLKEAINSRPIMVETKIELDGQQISYNQSTGTNSFRS